MAVFSARERLSRLIELAGQDGIAAREALAGELADLLLGWPAIYPQGMREPFEALLERTIGQVSPETRATLADRFAGTEEIPLSTLNLLVFDASLETRNSILLRNGRAAEGTPALSRVPVNEVALLAAARTASAGLLGPAITPRLGIPMEIAEQIFADASGGMLAVLCRGIALKRETFSALAVLARPNATNDESYRRLAAYDDVPETGAETLLTFWRKQRHDQFADAKAA
jgi:hypothetical protein